jgi:hypothetical protein
MKLFILLTVVYLYNSCRNKSNLARAALVMPSESPWERLYTFGDDDSFLHVTGFTRVAFDALVEVIFEGDEDDRKRGKKSLLSNQEKVGLLLMFLGSRMELKFLAMTFGITPSTVSRTIRTMIWKASRRLESNPIAEIRFPSLDEMVELAALVEAREPEVDNVIGFVDGLSLSVQCGDDEEKQALDYNGYHHDTRCNNVLAFSAKGKVIYACLNFPGSWHDTHVAAGLIDTVVNKLGNFAMCVDQGFPRKGEVAGKFVGPLSKRKRRALPVEVREEALRKHALYVSLRQAAEWGMRSLQGTFTRLKSHMTSERAMRERIVLCCVLLHNFRTELVGLNQIQAVFDKEYREVINAVGYDRIARYFN